MADFQVLVPLDGSPLADHVLPWVERLCRGARERGESPRVHLLTVLPDPDPAAATAARTHQAEVQARLERAGLAVEPHLRTGAAPGEAIVACARGVAPDLIAISSHGRSGVMRLVLGSVAEHVLRHAEHPLLLVTPRTDAPGPVGKILVPLDGSERSAAILPLVERFAAAEKAGVVLVRAIWDPATRPVMAAAFTPEWVVGTLEPWKERLERAGLQVEAKGAFGAAGREIPAVAEEVGAGLIAMATRGHEGLVRLLDGSVSEQVLRHARLPLLVVRAPE